MTDINFTQHWQQLYNKYLTTTDITPVLNDPATNGLLRNSIQKYNIPSELQDDFRQEVYITILQAFNTYDPTKCDKLLPFILHKITIATYQFLNFELYNGTFGTTYIRKYENTTPDIPDIISAFIDPLEEQEDESYTKARGTAFETWLRNYISDPLEWNVYCHQWGIFGYEKLTNEESSKRLNIDIEVVKKTKQKVASRMYQFLSTTRNSEKVFDKFGDLSYFLKKEYKNWGNFSNSEKSV